MPIKSKPNTYSLWVDPPRDLEPTGNKVEIRVIEYGKDDPRAKSADKLSTPELQPEDFDRTTKWTRDAVGKPYYLVYECAAGTPSEFIWEQAAAATIPAQAEKHIDPSIEPGGVHMLGGENHTLEVRLSGDEADKADIWVAPGQSRIVAVFGPSIWKTTIGRDVEMVIQAAVHTLQRNQLDAYIKRNVADKAKQMADYGGTFQFTLNDHFGAATFDEVAASLCAQIKNNKACAPAYVRTPYLPSKTHFVAGKPVRIEVYLGTGDKTQTQWEKNGILRIALSKEISDRFVRTGIYKHEMDELIRAVKIDHIKQTANTVLGICEEYFAQATHCPPLGSLRCSAATDYVGMFSSMSSKNKGPTMWLAISLAEAHPNEFLETVVHEYAHWHNLDHSTKFYANLKSAYPIIARRLNQQAGHQIYVESWEQACCYR